MGRTELKSRQIKDGTIQREDMDVTTPGKSVIARILPGANVTISSTGADTGTGDVTISATNSSVYNQFIHTQSEPNQLWLIEHNLDLYPEVTIIDQDYNKVFCELEYLSAMIVLAKFSQATSGIASVMYSRTEQFSYEEQIPSLVWYVHHNLGRYPEVVIFDTSMSGNRVYGDIKYISTEILSVTFANPMSGKLYLV